MFQLAVSAQEKLGCVKTVWQTGNEDTKPGHNEDWQHDKELGSSCFCLVSQHHYSLGKKTQPKTSTRRPVTMDSSTATKTPGTSMPPQALRYF